MSRWSVAVVLLAAAAAALWFGARPYLLVERALAAVPAPIAGSVTEEIRGRDSGCGQIFCPQRIRVFTVAAPASSLCDEYAGVVPSGARVLGLGEIGTARCGWIFQDGPVLVGVIVEEPPGGTELVVSARLAGEDDTSRE